MNVADNLLGGKAIEAWQDSPTVGILTYVALVTCCMLRTYGAIYIRLFNYLYVLFLFLFVYLFVYVIFFLSSHLVQPKLQNC